MNNLIKTTPQQSLLLPVKSRFELTNNTSLILEGGGFRGIYTAGILDRFLEENIHFPHVVGVSMGAILGMCYISDQKKRMIDWCSKYVMDRKYMSFSNLIFQGNFFSHDYGFNQEARRFIPFDLKSYYSAPEKFYFTATNVDTGEVKYFEKQEGEAINLALATSALPLFSQLINVGGQNYLDGGVYNGIPVDKPLTDGYEKIVAILTRPKGYRKGKYQENKLATTVYRNYPKLIRSFELRNERYNASLDLLDELERQGRAFIYTVNDDADFGLIQRDPKILRQNYQFGYDQADFRINELKDFLQS